jgi:hypothetical protein
MPYFKLHHRHDRIESGALCPRRGGNVPLAINGEAAAPLVWVSGVFMRATTIPIAIALIPLPALPLDQDEFCIATTDIVLRMNARKGRWLDRSTRHDGVELDCESRSGAQPTATMRLGAKP